MTPTQKGLTAALSANIIWGFTSIPIRALRNYSSEQILFSRIIVSLIFCWLFILLFKRTVIKHNLEAIYNGGKPLILLLALSGVFITLNWYTFIYVVNHTNLNTAAFAYMVCPIITAIAGFLILKEEITRLKFIGISLALISIITLATGSLTDVLWSIITASFYTFYIITQRVLNHLDKVIVLGINLIIALIITLPFFYQQIFELPNDYIFWELTISISIFFTLIPLFLSLYSLETLNSSTVGILIYINPVVAFSTAFLYFHESINPNQIFAYSLLIIAVIIFNWKIASSFFIKNRKIEG